MKNATSWPLLHTAAYRGIVMVGMLVSPRITEGHKLLAHKVLRWRELRGISTTTLSKAVDWPLAIIEDIERAERFDITLNDIDQLADALDVRPMELFVPLGHC